MLKIISPIDGSIYFESTYATIKTINNTLQQAQQSQPIWQKYSIAQRAKICHKAIDYFIQHQQAIATEITWQMGRPIQQSPGEINGLVERARYMIDTASSALATLTLPGNDIATRYIQREPWGTVLVIAPWNYPLLTTVNAVIPAIMAGNTVILKPSSQTALTAKHFAKAFETAGLPEGIFQYLFLDHQATENLVADAAINYVAFTGSVAGGQNIQQAAVKQFKGVGLELGGKDAAYVCEDADLLNTVENLVDGAFFNSGQSCCGIERIYVAEILFKDFVAAYVQLVKQYQLGNPLDKKVNLGPMIHHPAAQFVNKQIDAAVKQGATKLINKSDFATNLAENYVFPQVLINVNHKMHVMNEESFGPVVGIMPVKNDMNAIQLMNDSVYGLTASIWTQDKQRAINLGNQLQTGTVFMNRCDYLDPALAWTGVKNSGRGVTLSAIGYQHLTRVKSFNLKG